jgi:hypothetical protein
MINRNKTAEERLKMKKYIFALLFIIANSTINGMEEQNRSKKRNRKEAFEKIQETALSEKTNHVEDTDSDLDEQNLANQLDELLAQSIDGFTRPVKKQSVLPSTSRRIGPVDRWLAKKPSADSINQENEKRRKLRLRTLLICGNNPIAKALFSPEDKIQTTLIDLINSEKKSIKIAMYIFTSRNIADALINANDSDIDIELVVDGGQWENEYMKQVITLLAKKQIKIWVYPAPTGLNQSLISNGSYNFSKSANTSQENVTIMDDKSMIEQFTERFHKLKQLSKLIRNKRELQCNNVEQESFYAHA